MSRWTHDQASALFLRLRDLPPEQRIAELDALQDPSLRDEVCSLLEFDLADPAPSTHNSDAPPTQGMPSRVGPYTILQRLGQGSSGIVFLAQQDEPVRRRVALKVVPYAAISPELAARFDFERRALERMDHHNIARILDTGRTPEGLPYLVMEYVEGEPITTYVRARHLPLAVTLKLFLQVCEGVQHAHQRGIIHRDLKPANILVTDSNTQPLARVLDFGISKPAPGSPSNQAPPTSALAIGTPGYMAPEQTGGQTVDTRADVYALGAILYELTAGRPPIESVNDPVEDLVRLRDHVPAPASHARAQRPTAPDTRRERSMLADIDRILAVALEKDPARRFQTVAALADDLRRVLEQRPIEARPASFAYKVVKLAQRNAVLVFALIVVTLALILGVAGLAVGLIEARRQREQALDQTMALAEINRFLNDDLLAPASPQHSGEKTTVADLLDRAALRVDDRLADRPLIAAALHLTIGSAYMELGEFPKAERHLQLSTALRRKHAGPDAPDTLRSEVALATLLVRTEDNAAGADQLTELLARARQRLGDDDPLVYTILNELGVAEVGLDRAQSAAAHLDEALKGRTRLLGPKHPSVLASMSNLALALDRTGDTKAALAMDLKALALAESIPAPDRYTLIGLNNNIGATYQDLNQDTRAAPYIRKAVELSREYLGPEHPDTLTIQANLASLEAELGNPAQGIELFDAIVQIRTRTLGPQAPDTLASRYGYWNCVWIAGRHHDAAEGFQALLSDTTAALGPSHWLSAQTQAHLARALADAGDNARALPIATASVSALRNLYGDRHPRTVNAIAVLRRVEAAVSKDTPTLPTHPPAATR